MQCESSSVRNRGTQFRVGVECSLSTDHERVGVSPSPAFTCCTGADKSLTGSATLAGLPAVQLDRLQTVLECCGAAGSPPLQTSEVRPRVTVTRGTATALVASSRTYHLSVSSSCLSMSAQYGAAVPRRPAQPGEQCRLPAASTFVIVGRARSSSHQPRPSVTERLTSLQLERGTV